MTTMTGEGDATVSTNAYEPGNIYEYFNTGNGTYPKTTDDFTPTIEGLYFFRRTIKVDDSANTDFSETFTYAGYYFDGTDYYKIDNIRINEIPVGVADDGINDDGGLTKCPTVEYVTEEKKVGTPTLKYEAAVITGGANVEHPQRLVATLSTGTDADPSTLNGAGVDTLAVDADRALENVNAKKRLLDDAEDLLLKTVMTPITIMKLINELGEKPISQRKRRQLRLTLVRIIRRWSLALPMEISGLRQNSVEAAKRQ